MAKALTLPQQVVDLIHCNKAALEKAAQAANKQAAVDAAVAALIPTAVETCIKHERIDPAVAEKMAASLKDHAQCVELIIKLAKHRNASEITMGSAVASPATTKTANDNSNYMGRRGGGMKESDRKLFQGLGLPVPTE
jgi:hypothetical protein